MSSALRHDQLLASLRSRSRWSIDDLAAELEVSRRTMLRDLDVLRARGFHLVTTTGPGGGVKLDSSSVLVSSWLDDEQVVGLIIACAIAKATPGVPFSGAAEKALAKIEEAIPRRRAEQLNAVTKRILIGDPLDDGSGGPVSAGPIDEQLVVAFEASFSQQRLLEFAYRSPQGQTTSRRIEPHALLVRSPLWYIIAWDPTPDAPRLFRCDRIIKPKATDQHFEVRIDDFVTGVCPDARPLQKTSS